MQSGIVEDCCCDYETVDHLNELVLDPLLQELVKTPFFRYFKVCSYPVVTLYYSSSHEILQNNSLLLLH